jgi:redox-sensitive bicupin YhaK (pirin superfamily)
MIHSFTLRANERGHNLIPSEGINASYVAGHPGSLITRESSFNFHEYQGGRSGFGRMRVFGDEVFVGSGCGYNMHPHHNFVICAFVLQGVLTHVNTVGNVDQLHAGDYYVFSAGSGGKHAELSINGDEMHVIYLWFLPEQLFLPPSYKRGHFDATTRRNRIEELVGNADGALPIPQDVRISRLVCDTKQKHTYRLRSNAHGVYVFVLDGEITCEGIELARRDSAGIRMTDEIVCETGARTSDILFVETII